MHSPLLWCIPVIPVFERLRHKNWEFEANLGYTETLWLKNQTIVHFINIYSTLGCLLQIKYKQSAEMEKANFTSVVDTPEIIHAQQVKNLSSQVRVFIIIPLICPSHEKLQSPHECQRSYFQVTIFTSKTKQIHFQWAGLGQSWNFCIRFKINDKIAAGGFSSEV